MGLTPPLAEPPPEDVRAALERQFRVLVEGGAHRIYVVMDGARYAALQARLNAVSMSFRPLYRQVPGNEETVLGGPWLADPYLVSSAPHETVPDGADGDLSDEALEAKAAAMAAEMAAHVAAGDETGGGALPSDIIDEPARVTDRLRQILDVIDNSPGAVFWVTDRSVTAEMLFHHLRRINQMLVARNEEPPPVERSVSVTEARGYERVTFRHADPNVMMQVFPTLSPAQVSRLLGPAEMIFFAPDDEWGGGLKRGRRPHGFVPERGMLCLTEQNIGAIAESRLEASRRRRVNVFRRSAPHLLHDMDDHEALLFMERHERSARAHGLKTERGFFQWTYLMGASDGRFAESAEIRDHIRGANPDARLDDIMRLMANAAKEGMRA